MKKLLFLPCLLLNLATLPTQVDAQPQRPVNNPRPGRSYDGATPAAKPQVMVGTVVSQTRENLTIESKGKRQSFKIVSESKLDQLKTGSEVIVSYTRGPQGNQVVRAGAKAKRTKAARP